MTTTAPRWPCGLSVEGERMGLHSNQLETLNSVVRTLRVSGRDYRYVSLAALQEIMPTARIAQLPVSLKVLLENLLRNMPRGSMKPLPKGDSRSTSTTSATSTSIRKLAP